MALILTAVLALHAALLAWVLHMAPASPPSPPPPRPLDVRIIEALPPPKLAEPEPPKPAAVPPKPLPQAKRTPLRPRPAPKPPAVLAAPAEKAPSAAPFAVAPQPAAQARQEAPAIQPPAPAAPAQVASPASFDADYLQNPAPAYPAMSKRMREEGTVLLLVRVSPKGEAERVQIQKGSGFARLDDVAVKTVQQWRFVPARLGAETVAANVVVPIVFRLDS